MRGVVRILLVPPTAVLGLLGDARRAPAVVREGAVVDGGHRRPSCRVGVRCPAFEVSCGTYIDCGYAGQWSAEGTCGVDGPPLQAPKDSATRQTGARGFELRAPVISQRPIAVSAPPGRCSNRRRGDRTLGTGISMPSWCPLLYLGKLHHYCFHDGVPVDNSNTIHSPYSARHSPSAIFATFALLSAC